MTAPCRTAEIVAVGSELLTPHRLDTNSLFLTGALNELGIAVHAKSVVGDNTEDLASVLRHALDRADVVITTGGLGPTDDDLTRQVVASVTGRGLAENADVMATIENLFARRGVPMPAVNRRQALVIDGARWLPNGNGTAPGQLLELGGRLLVLLPGPPRELQPMFRESVAPVLAGRSQGQRLRRRVIKTTGRSESQIEEMAQPTYSKFLALTPSIETTVLASPGLVELHVSATGPDEAAVDAHLANAVASLEAVLGDAVFSVDGRTVEEVVGGLLVARQFRVATAESCTGGLLTQRLTDVPGSSQWVLGGVIAYDNAVKTSELGIADALLAEHGAVSEPVARAMAEGIRRKLGADVGIAITGIAGPGGGTEEKPVGTVYVAVASDRCDVRRMLFPGDRAMVRQFSAAAALNMLRLHLGSRS
jgi:nicotinamide-nucleotide amidase